MNGIKCNKNAIQKSKSLGMLLLAASHIKFVYNVYNYSFKIQVFLILKLFKNIGIHIIIMCHHTLVVTLMVVQHIFDSII